jgi:protein ImuB
MLWLALHLPLLPLEACCALLPEAQRAGPVALTAEHRISHVNAAAAARGVKPGMKRATALALAADLLLGEASAPREQAAQLALAHAALAFTPAVALHGPDVVLLEVQGSLRLFGGLRRLLARLNEAIAPLGHAVQRAAAPTALGAALLARWAPAGRGDPLFGPHATRLPALQALLDDAPVWLLGPGREHWEALQGMGLQRLSDLRHLPRAGLARRFGAALLDDIDRAFGRRPDPQIWIELPERFDARLELFALAENAEQVLAAAGVLLARLVAWAQARCARIAAFTLTIHHEPRHGAPVPATALRIELAEPTLAAAHLQLLLRERLARIELPAPTLELALHCHELKAGAAASGELFPTRRSEGEGLVRLLERLRARLGDERVLRLQAVADHRPGRASRGVPALGPGEGAAPPTAAQQALPLHRPAFLLPEPLPLAERDALPLLDGRPLLLLSGPERVETGWWDGAPEARDYFIAECADGSLVWLWRGRFPAVPAAPAAPPARAQWFLQGRFA